MIKPDRYPSYERLLRVAPIPDDVQKLLQPSLDLSIPSFIRMRGPCTTADPTVLSRPGLFSQSPSSISTSDLRMLLSQPVPSLDALERFVAKDGPFLSALAAHNASFNLAVRGFGDTLVDLRLPLWTITYWYRVRLELVPATRWTKGRDWLRSIEQRCSTAVQGLSALDSFTWGYELPRELGEDPLSLTRFLGHIWLSDENMDQMSRLLERELVAHSIPVSLMYCGTFLGLLNRVYRRPQTRETYMTERSVDHLHQMGYALCSDPPKDIAISVPVRVGMGAVELPKGENMPANHWVTVIITVKDGSPRILYGDPMQLEAPLELLEMLRWWLKHYYNKDFAESILPCTKQSYGFSCGILSTNAKQNYYFPQTHPLLDPQDIDEPRIKAFVDVVKAAQTLVRSRQIVLEVMSFY